MTTSPEPSRPTAEPSLSARPLGGLREVSLLAYPVVLTQLSITTMQLVDSAMVGRLGATELAAVGFGGIWMWTMMCFFIGITTAVQTFVSQAHGAGREHDCGPWTWQGLYATVPLTALAAVALFFGVAPLIAWIGPSDALRPLATGYIEARAFGAVGMTGAVALSSFFRGIGDTRIPLYTTLVSNIVNAILDYGLIFGELGLPRLGVEGAGYATSIAEWVYLFATLAFFCRPSVVGPFATRRVPPVWREIRRILRTGVPIGGQWWLEMTSFAAFSTLVVRMGDAPMAASQAFILLLSLSFMQAIGLSIAVTTLVGRYIGAEDLASAERSFRAGLVLAMILAVGIALLFVSVPGPLIRLFSDDAEVIALARPLLLMGAFYQLFDAIAIMSDGALHGAGDTRWPFVARLLLSWGLFLPLAYAIGFTLEGGLTGAWLGGLVYVAVLAATLFLRFRSRAWQAIEI